MPIAPESTAISTYQPLEGSLVSTYTAGPTPTFGPEVPELQFTETQSFDPDDLSVTPPTQPSINIRFEDEAPWSPPGGSPTLLSERDSVSRAFSSRPSRSTAARLHNKRWTPLSPSQAGSIIGGIAGSLVGLAAVAGLVHWLRSDIARSCTPSMRRWPSWISGATRGDQGISNSDGAPVELGPSNTAEWDPERFGYGSSPLPREPPVARSRWW